MVCASDIFVYQYLYYAKLNFIYSETKYLCCTVLDPYFENLDPDPTT